MGERSVGYSRLVKKERVGKRRQMKWTGGGSIVNNSKHFVLLLPMFATYELYSLYKNTIN